MVYMTPVTSHPSPPRRESSTLRIPSHAPHASLLGSIPGGELCQEAAAEGHVVHTFGTGAGQHLETWNDMDRATPRRGFGVGGLGGATWEGPGGPGEPLEERKGWLAGGGRRN